ncbi:MAG TPA: DNA (cytosine-5-)-methyltransferase [Chthoniobacterales bacterium]|nr:DNA (cytosine-5-)-methyltransferase [Chthoniobacterales bacterium]
MKRRSQRKSAVREQPAEYAPGRPKFVDLFCGIGGFRIAFERAGCECVFSSDWDKHAQLTYEANFGERPHGDIHSVAVKDIPAHDVLCAGFPCQPFSIAGVSKKLSLGRKHGFDDEAQGNLFFSIAAVLDHHRPQGFVLENVKNLRTHDKGRTFDVIHRTLTEGLGYTVYHKLLDARRVVPQHRERIFLVGFRERRYFEFPRFTAAEGPKLGSILGRTADPKYTLTDHLWQYLQDYAAKHRAAGNGFGFGAFAADDVARTLSARYYKDGSEILIKQNGKNPRRLTPRECARLMGFPDTFKIPVSDTQAYRQFGNSVVVPIVEAVARAVVDTLSKPAGTPYDLVLEDKPGPTDRTRRKSVKYTRTRKAK